MNPRRTTLKCCLLAFCWLAAALAQDEPPQISPPPVAAPPEEHVPGSITGTVLSGATGQPLRRAQVVLRPGDSKGESRYQNTDESGSFSFPSVPPGQYIVTVQREGYLPLSAGRIGDYKMPPLFSVNSGQAISSLVYRLAPAGIIAGKVKFDDAEPAPNVAIQLYRSYYDRGRHGYSVAASTRTDDRGEYRAHGLEPGTYYVAALYQAPLRPSGAQEQPRTDANGNPLPTLSYAVTFFPQVQRMADAAPVKISPGDEVDSIDIYLTLVHTVHVRGRVISGIKGAQVPNPAVTLRWNDPDNTASVTAPTNVTVDKDQNFDIQGVTAGPYLLMATGTENGTALTGRVPISVGDADITNADVVVAPESMWTGKVHIDDGDTALPKDLMIALEPRHPTASPTRAEVSPTGDFSVAFVPGETYDLYVLNAPDNSYLKSVRMANAERLGEGLEASGSDTPPPLDVSLSSQGAQISGRAVTADAKVVASGATVALIPDPPAGRVQAYQMTHADEYGNFLLKGIPPGKYVVVAWLDSPPCEVYNPDDFVVCAAQGTNVVLDEGSQSSIQVTAN